MRIWLGAVLVAALLIPANAQHNHAQGHNDYQGWASQVTSNCCNNQDCRGLRDDETRETATGTEILIEGQWCPVLQQHRLIRGRSPDWSVNHACITTGSHGGTCGRLLCYTPKGGF